MNFENTPEMEAFLKRRSAGGVVIGDSGMIALVRHKGRTEWLFPKGTVEDGETDEAAARREIEEEASLTNLEFLDDFGIYSRPRLGADGKEIPDTIKEIHMFLFAAEPHTEPIGSMEIEEAKWFPYRELANIIGYDKDRAWFSSVFERVRQAIQRD